MTDYNYPAELIKKAETRIRRQLDGNGVDPKEIKLTVKRQGIGTFTAQTSYTIDTDVQANQIKGQKSQGEILESGKTQETIQSYITELQSKDSLSNEIKEQIRALALKGFGASGDVIQLGSHKKTYTEHTPCGTCQAKGQATCGNCHGQGRSQCQLCHARGFVRCLHCQGSGEVQNGEHRQACTYCQGKREIFCTQCHGQKMTSCATCQTKGTISCGSCNGEGKNSLHTSVTPIAKITSAIHLQELDDEPKTFANKVGALALAKGGHIDISEFQPLDDEEAKKPGELSYYEDDETPENTENQIHFEAKMPWAVAGVEVNKKPYNIAFIGKKGAIADAGHFMDDILDKPFLLLKEAAHGNGFVAGLLKDACETRVSRETLSAVTTSSRKKAMVTLSKSYEIGLSKQSLHAFVQNSYLALKRVTRRPRYIGLAIGLILSGALYYFWFMNGGRDMTSAHPQNTRWAMDAIPLVIGTLMTLMSIKGVGFITFRSVMRGIGIKTNKMPMAGTAGLHGLIGNLLIWGGLFGMMFM